MIKPIPMVTRHFAERVVVKGIGFILVAIIIAAHPVFAQSLANSSWPIFRSNTFLHAFSPVHGPSLPEIKWETQFGSGQLGSPVVGLDGTIYVPGNEDNSLYALTSDGKLKWTFTGRLGGREERFVAPPVIAQDGTIYLGSTKNLFYAVRPTGTELWYLELGGSIIFSANIGLNGTIYVAAQDCQLYAITRAGEVDWKTNLDRLPVNGPAIMQDGMICVAAATFLKWVKPDGTILFEFENDDMGGLNGLMVDGNAQSYITALKTPFIRAFDKKQRIFWERKFESAFKGSLLPAMGKGGRIYFAAPGEGAVVALDQNGNQIWRFTMSGAKNISELVVDDSNHVYIVNDKDSLTSVSADGKLRWSLGVLGAFSPAFGSDGTLYLSSNRKLYAIQQARKAASLTEVSGDSQTGCINTALSLPIVVQVKDQNGDPFPGQRVDFSIISGGGSVNPPVDTTDSNGFAQTTWTLGPQLGQQQLQASSNGANGPLQGSPIIFTATAIAPAFDGASQVLFDSTEVKQASEKFYVIRNNSDCVLRIDSVRIINDANSSFSLCTTPAFPISIQPGKQDSLCLRFAPTVCGSHTGTLRIFNNDPAKSPFDVALRGATPNQPDIEVASALNFTAPICRQTSDTLDLPIFNLGCADLRITNLAVSNPVFRVISPITPFTISPSGQRNVQVVFTPVDTIAYNGVLTITSNDPDESTRTVNLSGKGKASDIRLTAPPFGNVCIGQTATSRVCIINPSDCALRVDTVRISSSALAAQQLSGALQGQHIIPPKDSLCFDLIFEPLRPGNFTVEVTVVSNAPTSPIKISIPGIALPSDIGGVPAEVRFPQIEVQTCAGHANDTTQTFTLRNDGACDLRIDSLRTGGVFSVVLPSVPQIVAPGAGLEITLRFAPSDTGNFNGVLRIISNDPDESPVSVALRGRAISAPDIVVSPLEIDFGRVAIGSSGLQEVVIRNLGAVRLQVDSLVTSLRVFTADQRELILECNQDSSVTVAFTPTDTGLVEGTLSIFNNDPNENPVVVKLRGVGVVAVAGVSPLSIDFGVICGDSSGQIIVSNRGEVPLRVDSLIFSPQSGAFSNTPAVILPLVVAPGDSEAITIRFFPTTSDSATGTLSLYSSDPNVNPVVVNLRGQGGSPDIGGLTAVAFDTVEIQTCAGINNADTVMYEIKNLGICDLKIDTLLTNASAFAVIPNRDQTIPAGSSLTVKLIFSPSAKGDFSGNLIIRSDDPKEREFMVTLRGAAREMPDIDAMPTLVDFGSVSLGSSKRSPVIIRNLGAAILLIGQIVTTSPAFASEAGEFPLNCSESEEIEVTFTPKDTGLVVDTLKIFNNDPNENPKLVLLRGVGVTPEIAVMPNPLDFGVVCNGADSTLPVIVKNEGSDTLRVTSLIFSNPAFSTTHSTSFNVLPGRSDSILVHYVSIPDSTQEGTLTIVSNDVDEDSVVVQLRGKGAQPDIIISAPAFGEVCVGSIATSRICIFNPSDCLLQVELRFIIRGLVVSQTQQQLPNIIDIKPKESFCFDFDFSPDEPGEFSVVVVALTNIPDKREVRTPPIRGYAPAPNIAGVPAVVNFPQVEVEVCSGNDKFSTQTFTVRNDSLCGLNIDSLYISGPFSISPQAPRVVPAGGSLMFTLQFTPPDTGNFTGTLLIVNGDPDTRRLSVALRGRAFALPDIAVAPRVIEFGSVQVGSSKSLDSLKVTNERKHTLRVDSLVIPPSSVFRTPRSGFVLQCDEDRRVTITFAPTSDSSYVDTLKIYSNDPDERLVRVILRGNATPRPPSGITGTPDSLDFGVVCKSVDSLITTISNVGQTPVQVDTLRFSNPVFSSPQTLPFVLPVNGSKDIVVLFKPVVPGRPETGTLTIASKDTAVNKFVVSLKGKGGVPDIAVDSVKVNFPPVALSCAGKDSSERRYVIRNLGDCELVIEALLTDLPFSVVSPSVPQTIRKGDSLIVTLRFTPDSARVYTGVLRIKSNDPDEPSTFIDLRGEGVSEPDIATTPTSVDFGAVCSPDTGTAIITVVNDGKAELQVNSLIFSNPVFFTLQGTPFAVPACSSKQIVIHFKPIAGGDTTGTLSIFSNDPDENPKVIKLQGIGGAPNLVVNPSPVRFDTVKVTCNGAEPDTQTIEIRNAGTCSLAITLPNLPVGVFSIIAPPPLPIILPPGGSVALQLQFAPSVPGIYDGQLTIGTNDPDTSQLIVPLHGVAVEGLPQIAVVPDTLDFGSVPVDSTKRLPITITSLGLSPLRVDSLVISCKPFTAETNEIFLRNCNDDSLVMIAFKPTFAGPIVCTLKIYNNDPDSSDNPLVVILRGNGTPPQPSGIAATPDSLDFGTVCGPADLIVTITNLGQTPVQVDTLRFSNPVFSSPQTPPPSFNVPANGSVTITVRFTPLVPGRDEVGTLTIISNEPGINKLVVNLHGQGGVPDIAVQPDSLDFETVFVGSTKDSTITIRSVGGFTLEVDTLLISAPQFTTLTKGPFNLACGKDSVVTITFRPDSVGFFAATLSIVNNDASQDTFIVRLSGRGARPDTAPPFVTKVCLGDRVQGEVEICNHGATSLDADTVVATQKLVKFEPENDIFVPAGGCTKITIVFDATKVGIFHDTLKIEWNPPLKLPPLLVPITIEVVGPQITGAPNPVIFDTTGVSKKDTMQFTIKGVGCDLTIKRLTITGTNADEFRMLIPPDTPYIIAKGGSSVLTLEFAPDSLGMRTAQLNIFNNDPDPSDSLFVVQLIGNAAAGILQVCKADPTPSVCLGDSDRVNYTLCNVGKGVLNIEKVEVKTGQNFRILKIAPGVPTKLQPDSSIIVAVTFAPTQLPWSDTLLVYTDLPDQSFRMLLNGIGKDEPGKIAVSHDTLYIQGRLNQVIERKITLINIGCQSLQVNNIDLERHVKGFEIIDPPKSIFPIPLGNNDVRVVTLRFTGYKFGVFKDTLLVLNDDEMKQVPLRAEVNSDRGCLQVPDTLDFGEVVVEQSREKSLNIFNADTSSWLDVKDVKVNRQPSEFSVSSQPLPFRIYPGSTSSLVVRFTPKSSGVILDRLILETNNADSCGGSPSFVILRGIGTGNLVYAQPNAFTPNGDDKNDRAKIRFAGFDSSSVSLRIFDLRSIELRYFTQKDVEHDNRGIFIGWDGLDASGRIQLPGPYLWIFEERGKKVGSGVVVLVR